MNARVVMLSMFLAGQLVVLPPLFADGPSDELAAWLDRRGLEVWGDVPELCDDLTFVRRAYLDILGRVPSVSEIRDFQDLGQDRRRLLVDQLVFGGGPRAETYERQSARNLARVWRRVLVPPGTTVGGPTAPLEGWLRDAFAERVPYDEMMRQLAQISASDAAGGYYRVLGSMPETYAGHLSRVMLGVRIECAQCHDHPFTDWKQEDFWGLAAFYSDLPAAGEPADASGGGRDAGSIEHEGTVYTAKLLWSEEPIKTRAFAPRIRLAEWITAADNPNFASTAANRVWQYLLGRGLYPDVENLDQASADERNFLDDLGQRLADEEFDLHRLIAAVCKSSWYQAVSAEGEADEGAFVRPLKVIGPEQLFDSLEQALLLPVSRIDPSSPRWSGERNQLVSRLSETIGATPEDYASGIPQALLLMNGTLTGDAIDLERSRLLRAVVDSPFLDAEERIGTLYLAVLTRQPTLEETEALSAYLAAKPDPEARKRGYGEILWALLNSPEFVLCR